jgi:hypothetical protein
MIKRRMLLSGMAACVFSAAMLCGAFARPASAQAPDPKAEAYFQRYIAANPELQRDPSLMSNPGWLNAHPDFRKFLQNHPNVANQAHQMGAYDNHHKWHNRNWWVKHNPNWVQQNQPGWLRPQTGPANDPYANSPWGRPPYPPGPNPGYAHPPYAGAPYAGAPNPAYGHPGYPGAPYAGANPSGPGAYDDHHQWHDRNWWVSNQHAWVEQHHPEWVHH